MNNWISVEDRLPDNQSLEDKCNDYVLVAFDEYPSARAMFAEGEWYWNYVAKIIKPVTHWQPLPEPPEEK